jgi:K+-transporting ATPase ATPase C chain
MTRLPTWLRQHVAAVRILLVLTVVLGVGYPLAITAIAQIPGLKDRANGSLAKNAAGQVVGSAEIGQSFTDKNGNPVLKYLQSRPSAAGNGYDPTATSASNLGPESVLDTLPDPSVKGDTGTQSLRTQVCARSLAVGRLEGVSGARPFCTASGVGAALVAFYAKPGYQGAMTRVVSVNEACPATPFIATYAGVKVQCGRFGEDYGAGKRILVRGNAPAHPAVPPDAVTASASGLDPDISTAYAALQVPRVAKARGITVAQVTALIHKHTAERALGFLGEPAVNVLQLNIDLDRVSR